MHLEVINQSQFIQIMKYQSKASIINQSQLFKSKPIQNFELKCMS